MCGRYTLSTIEGLQERFALSSAVDQVTPNYNSAPTQQLPVIVRNSPNRLVLMRWGLIPSWVKQIDQRTTLINARAETLSEKPSFRKAFASQRCLIPTTGFYEWQQHERGKQPYFIRLRDQGVFAFAGLYDRWRDPQGGEIHSFTIITTEPNELMGSIHTRMPVILTPAEEEHWLDPRISAAADLMPLLDPYPSEAMEAYPVSALVNSPRNNTPSLIDPVA
ncbi:MAG: SOS response-associated peptidase [Roseiflexaceae bacterium]